MFLPGDAGVLAAAKALGPPEWGQLTKGHFLKDNTYFHWLNHQRTDQDLLPLPCAPLRSLGHSPPSTMAGGLHPPRGEGKSKRPKMKQPLGLSAAQSPYPSSPSLNLPMGGWLSAGSEGVRESEV